ncbi:hypothetical protein LUTEI9C_10115 [Luteimonas sp. 9C]|nr:hypothetical protein LUTEI9C_10115 [Luteimonas sp. 9C]
MENNKHLNLHCDLSLIFYTKSLSRSLDKGLVCAWSCVTSRIPHASKCLMSLGPQQSIAENSERMQRLNLLPRGQPLPSRTSGLRFSPSLRALGRAKQTSAIHPFIG